MHGGYLLTLLELFVCICYMEFSTGIEFMVVST